MPAQSSGIKSCNKFAFHRLDRFQQRVVLGQLLRASRKQIAGSQVR
jgi:hypothetical protein